jgi:hypothetical protein
MGRLNRRAGMSAYGHSTGECNGWASEPPKAPGCYNIEYFDPGKRHSPYHNKRFYKLQARQPRNRCLIHGKDKIFVYTRGIRIGSVKEILPGGGKLSGRAKASLSSSGKLKNEWIYKSAPPWAFTSCNETSLLLHIIMALCENRTVLPSSCTKRPKCSDSHSVLSTHVGSSYLESATYK